MHYIKLVIAVAIGIALWQLAVRAAAEGSISNPYALMGAEAATIVAAMVVVGMIF